MWGDCLLSLSAILIAVSDQSNHKNLIEQLKVHNTKVHLCDSKCINIEISVLKYEPDVLILEITDTDPESVRRLIKNIMFMKKRPFIFVICPYEDHYIKQEFQAMNFVKFIGYPYIPSELTAAVNEYINKLPVDISQVHSEIIKAINDLLMLFEFHSGMHGFSFLRNAIFMYVLNHESKINFSKNVYPETARKYDTTPECVEWAIRSAISKTWPKASSNIKVMFFDKESLKDGQKPTNSEFITALGSCVKKEFYYIIEKSANEK